MTTKVLLVAFAICLSQVAAAPQAPVRRDGSPTELLLQSPNYFLSAQQSLAQTAAGTAVEKIKELIASVVKSVISALQNIWKIFLENYKVFRTAVIPEVNRWLKGIGINSDFGVWLDGFEKALFDCARARKVEIVQDAKLLLNETLVCIRTNVEDLTEMQERGLLALAILGETSSVYRSEYERCKGKNKPAEPTATPTVPPPRTSTRTSVHRTESSRGSPHAFGMLEDVFCVASAVQKVGVHLVPVPGHIYAFLKMVFNVSVTERREVERCLLGKLGSHAKFIVEVPMNMVKCVALSS